MKFAVLADIHGNSAALKAVLDDMGALGLKEAVNLGDHFSGPLDASGTADLLLAHDFQSIRGNHDRWLIEEDPAAMAPSDRVAFEQLNRSQINWLRSLPPTRRLSGDVFLCHGTPRSDLTYWLEKVDPNGQIRSADLNDIEAEADNLDARLILCGHTHVPRSVRLSNGRTVLNPGSVGCPAYTDDTPVHHVMQTGTPNASYAIVERVFDTWAITHRSVPYDASPMIERAQAGGRRDWAQALATGWISS